MTALLVIAQVVAIALTCRIWYRVGRRAERIQRQRTVVPLVDYEPLPLGILPRGACIRAVLAKTYLTFEAVDGDNCRHLIDTRRIN